MRAKLVAGNWKMHGSLATNLGLLHAVRDGARGRAEVALCVPYPYLAQARSVLAGGAVAWGAQDVSEHAQGAWTGEVSGAMLADFDCRYALVGHSERRSFFGDTDAVVAAKFVAAQKSGVTTVLFNANPLLRYDGYYVLSDVIDLPNLYQRAQQMLLANGLIGLHEQTRLQANIVGAPVVLRARRTSEP